MALFISKENDLSSDPNWEKVVDKGNYFVSRLEIPEGGGDRLLIAMSGCSKFFSKLSEYGHVFVIEPEPDTFGTVEGTAFMNERFTSRAFIDENRLSLMTVDGETERLEYVDRDGFLGLISIEFVKEPVLAGSLD